MDTEKRERALWNERRCDEGWTSRNKGSMLMGWAAAEMRREDQFPELGYATEKAFWTAKGYAKSTWHRMVRIAEAFPELAEHVFLRMKVENAEALSYEKPEHRYDAELLERAAIESEDVFSDRIGERKMILANRPPGEAPVKMKFHLKKSQREAIHEGLQEWMRTHEIQDEGEALEMLVAEYTGRLTLVGYYKESIGRLKRAAQHATELIIREELLSMAAEMQDALEIVIGAKPKMEMVA